MVQQQTMLDIADNYGAKRVMCIKVLGGTRRKYASIGDVIIVAVKEALPNSKVKKGDVARAVIVRTRRELKRVIRRIGITTLFVTHEQEEAFDLGDRVAVLSGGRLEQVGVPEELYARAATRFVAGFVGRSSALPAVWRAGRAELAPGVAWPAEAGEPLSDGQAIELLVRPEDLAFGPPVAAGDSLGGAVLERRFAGHATFYTVALDGVGEAEVLGTPGFARPGDRVAIRPAPGAAAPRAYAKEPAA